MRIPTGITKKVREVGQSGHLPVIAVRVWKKHLRALSKLGFNVSERKSKMFHASLTGDEIVRTAEQVKSGYLRHSRPLPRDKQLAT